MEPSLNKITTLSLDISFAEYKFSQFSYV